MMCAKCEKEFTEMGGLLFSPPDHDKGFAMAVYKRHLCPICYELVRQFVDGVHPND